MASTPEMGPKNMELLSGSAARIPSMPPALAKKMGKAIRRPRIMRVPLPTSV